MSSATKAYHRFWAEGRPRVVVKKGEDDDAPWWAVAIAVVLILAGLVLVFLFVLKFWVGVYQEAQLRNVDWCAEYGGKLSIGAFGNTSCYDLTPKKQEKP